MKLRTVLSLITCCAALVSSAKAQTTQKAIHSSKNQNAVLHKQNDLNDESGVHQVIDNFVEAFRAKNLEMMMSLYAPDFVAFDFGPPLQDVGKNKYKEVWEKVFTFFKGPIVFETRNLRITAGTGVAFSHQLLRLQATMANGRIVDRWERLSFGFQKVNGKWLIVHEHVSVPADLLTDKAALDLQP
jgi:ketosteroid isomerase-like protein